MHAETLVRMANQIAGAFATMPDDEAAAAVAHHLTTFWDPRMRRAIAAYAAEGGEGLVARAKVAVFSLDT